MILTNNFNGIESFDVTHLPIIRAYLEKLNVVNIIDRALNTQMQYNPGRIVMGLVQDTLAGRTPLYRVEEFFEHQDIELVIGEDLPSTAFNDDNIGRVLDRIFNYGTQKLFSEVCLEAIKQFKINTNQLHSDTTSVNVWGNYLKSPNDKAINLTYGYSKDHRPDLKQFIFSLLCAEKNIPIYCKTEDGNASDKTINKNMILKITKYMSKYGVNIDNFLYTGDSALITSENLEIMGGLNREGKIEFISRLPMTFNECARLIKEAVKSKSWKDIGILSLKKSTKNRPSAFYKSYESTVTINGEIYRAIVIHSNFYDKRKQKRIDRELEQDEIKLKKVCKELNKLEFYNKKDAEAIAGKQKSGKYHKIEWSIEDKKIYRRGRPKNGKKEVINIRYVLNGHIKQDDKLIENLRKEAGCFVLLSNVTKEEHTSKEILEIYKDQYGIETNFVFLKDPLIVNDLFLKKPERIEALGLILLIALLAWRLIERDMRNFIERENITITGWDNKQTKSPTSFMMTTKFDSVHVLKYGNRRWLSRELTPVQIEYLNALGLNKEIFVEARTKTENCIYKSVA